MRGILVAVALITSGCPSHRDEDECTPIIGQLIDETGMCVDRSSGARVDMGCNDPMMPCLDTTSCYEHAERDIRVWTPCIYPELESQGWRDCDSDWYSTIEERCW